jgi:hypothetical protein
VLCGKKKFKNTAEPDRTQMTIWRMDTACWIPKATNTHSEYVKLIGFLWQQWMNESASVLRCACIACLVRQRNFRREQSIQESQFYATKFFTFKGLLNSDKIFGPQGT